MLLSIRDSAETWWQSADATILPVARMALGPDWNVGLGLVNLLKRFAGSGQWDEPAKLTATYAPHNAEVRKSVVGRRFLEWRAEDGWAPICRALNVPVPDEPFPWLNRGGDWS